jgi:hypothetical protein
MGNYRTFGTALDRVFRNDLNNNFTEIATDIEAQKIRVDNLVVGAGNSNSEIVDARGGKAVLKDRLDAVDTSLADMTTQLTDVVTVNAHSFGAKGNGTDTDTTHIQDSFNALKNGNTYILPYGTYRLDNRVTISASNCNFYFFGDFKMSGGVASVYGLVTINGSNNNFYGLTIDGNRDDPTIIDGAQFGVTANLVIGTGISNLYFKNTTLTNSKYTACIFNGNSSNVVFDGADISNIGEHVFYVSGGNNNDITWKNITSLNIGLQGASYDPNHEGYFIKSKANAYGNNSNFHVYNIIFDQKVAPDYGAFFMNVQELTSADIDRVFWRGLVTGITGSATTGVVKISNLDTTGVANNYGNIFFANNMPASDVTITNSSIGGFQSNLNVCHRFQNCKFYVNVAWGLIDVSAWTQYWDLIFDDCTFIFSTAVMSYPIVNQNVFFRDCDFVSTSATSVANAPVTFGSTSFNSAYTVTFNGGKNNTPNFSYSIFTYNNANLKLMNFSYTNRPKASVNHGVLTLLNVTSGNSGIFVGTYTTLVARGVYYNNQDFSEYKGQLTIPSGGTTSNTVNLQFQLVRAVQLADVILSPVGDTGGIRYYPTLSGTTLSVTCNSAAPSAITFNVLVKANS